jgi:hypothetical protein
MRSGRVAVGAEKRSGGFAGASGGVVSAAKRVPRASRARQRGRRIPPRMGAAARLTTLRSRAAKKKARHPRVARRGV